MTKAPESLLKSIRNTSNIVLATHVNPDGDAFGSLLGLAIILEGMGKQVFRFAQEPVPRQYQFFPDSGKIQWDYNALNEFARAAGNDLLLITLDCGDKKRLGDGQVELLKIKPVAVIDHHQGNSGFGNFAWIEPHRSSTGEMIFDLAGELKQTVPLKAANCLYAAILTDTGSFRYESTSAHTFSVVRDLVSLGVKPHEIAGHLYDNYTVGRLQLMQLVLATMEIHEDGKIAVIKVTREMFDKTSTSMEETENFINLPRAIQSVQVAVFLKEAAGEVISASLRAKGGCDLSAVASIFKGGGHRNAAGFRQSGKSLDEVKKSLLTVLKKQLAS
jgi:phosphoesterase RecJ-like protein